MMYFNRNTNINNYKLAGKYLFILYEVFLLMYFNRNTNINNYKLAGKYLFILYEVF